MSYRTSSNTLLSITLTVRTQMVTCTCRWGQHNPRYQKHINLRGVQIDFSRHEKKRGGGEGGIIKMKRVGIPAERNEFQLAAQIRLDRSKVRRDERPTEGILRPSDHFYHRHIYTKEQDHTFRVLGARAARTEDKVDCRELGKDWRCAFLAARCAFLLVLFRTRSSFPTL